MKQHNLIRWLTLTLIFCGLHVSIAHTEIIGMWLFDEAKGKEVQDTSGRKHTGTLMGGAKWSNGKFGDGVTYDGKDVLLFLDGKDAGGQKASGPMSQTGAVVHVSNSCCGGRFMEAVVDEFVMANHAMTQAEIATFADKGIALTLAVQPQEKLTTTWGKIKEISYRITR